VSDYPSDDDVLLGGGGPPTFRFETLNDGVLGTILHYKVEQATDIDGNLQTWDDGRPRMQAVVTLQTELRDRAIDDDDGQRRVFVKGRMLQGLQRALRDAGLTRAKDCIGGMLRIVWTGEGKAPRRGYSRPKLYDVQFQPAAEPVGGRDTRPAPSTTPDPTPDYSGADDDIPF